MLAHRVHIAKVLLEPMLVANAGGPHGRMHEIDRLPSCLNGMAGGELHGNPLFGGDFGAGAEGGPGVVQCVVEIGAGRIDHRLGARHSVLDGGPIAKGHLRVVGDLASGEGDTVLDRGAGNPERHAGNRRPKQPETKRIQWTTEGRAGVIEGTHDERPPRGDEDLGELHVMAAGAPHPQRVPRVDDLGLRRGEEEHDLHRLAVGPPEGSPWSVMIPMVVSQWACWHPLPNAH